MFYSRNFEYPKDFNNTEYLEKLNEFLVQNSNKEFVKDYRKMKEIEKKIKTNINTIFSLIKRYINIIYSLCENYNSHFNNEILFLDKCYKANEPRFGYKNYLHINYYKALDMEPFRKILNSISLGAWKRSDGIRHSYNSDYKTCVYHRYFSWKTYENIEKGNKKLEEELGSIKNSNIEEIEKLIQGKYIIESNSNLDYETLLGEYYSNFGMNPKEFVEMIQRKYACNIVCPNIESQSTKLVVRKAS